MKKWTFPAGTSGALKVSILIPARNEEHNIRKCLDSLLNQDYENYEILVLDDNSCDGTYHILQEYEMHYPKVRILQGLPLSDEWSGKQFACQQLSEAAEGELFFFTDADTVHLPQSISWAVTNIEKHNASFLSAYVRHLTGSWGEALVIPAIYIMTTIVMPLWLIPKPNHYRISFGIGQLLICRAVAFRAIGGFTKFKKSVVEDMDIARMMKSWGYKTLFLDAREYVRCRMYDSYVAACNGLIKNIFGAINRSVPWLVALFLLIAGVIEFPLFYLLQSLIHGSGCSLWMAAPVCLFFATWFIVMLNRRMPLFLSFLYPLVFLNLLGLAVISMIKTGFGRGAVWKGRYVKCHMPTVYGEKNTYENNNLR